MNFKHWLISEEIFPNKTATVYHRTCQNCDEDKSIKSVSSILTSDYKVGKGCYYGCGLYTTFAIKSQFTNYMQTYGKAVVKFKVEELDKYLIFQLSEAKQIHGKDYKISDQFKKLGLLNKPNVNEIKLKEYDERQEKEKYSSTLAKEFYEQNDWIVNSVKGIIYYGENDGYCLLKYPTVQDGTITMLGYAVAEHDDMKKMEELKNNIGWIKSVGVLGTSIKNVYKSPIKNKERFAFGDTATIVDQLLKSKNLEKTAQKLVSHLNKLSDQNVRDLLNAATDKNKMADDKEKMAEVIAKYKQKLSDKNVENLLQLWPLPNKDKIAELIIKNKKELSWSDVQNLLHYANDQNKIAELIIKGKSELDDEIVTLALKYADSLKNMGELIISKKLELDGNGVNVYLLLVNATDQDKMAELLGTNNMNKLSYESVEYLLEFATDKEKIAELIIKYKTELSDNNVRVLLHYAEDKDKMAELLQKETDNISKLSDDSVSSLVEYRKDGKKFAQIINKYHQNKTPEIQEILDKYLQPQTIAAK